MATTTDDLVRRFRSDVDDPLRGPSDAPDMGALWSIEDVTDYMTEACDRVARHTLSLYRTFELPVTAGNPECPLPGSFVVLDILRVRLKADRRDLEEVNVDGTTGLGDDYCHSRFGIDWEDLRGSPRAFTRGYKPKVLRLIPAPLANDTMVVTATVSPQVVAGAPLPFESSDDVHLLLLWMKKLAYSKHDADTYDPARADKFEAEFERRVLDRKYDAQRIRRAPQPVRFAW